MDKTTYSASLNLTKLKHGIKTFGGKKCVVLPVEDNMFFEGEKGGIYVNTNIIVRKDPDQFGQYGFVAQKVPSDVWKAASAEERKAFDLPILGNLVTFEKASNETSGEVDLPDADDGDDGLPF
jgi:hypothetical protein